VTSFSFSRTIVDRRQITVVVGECISHPSKGEEKVLILAVFMLTCTYDSQQFTISVHALLICLWHIIIIIIIQHLYSAMESEDTEALGGARLRHVKQMSF